MKNDNYSTGAPIDCYDPKTGLYHQVKGRLYDSIERCWSFAPLEKNWNKKYGNMVCYCISKDGKMVERIYKIPSFEIINRRCIKIVKNPMNSRGTSPIVPWYEQYRATCEEELEKVNEIWKGIIGEK